MAPLLPCCIQIPCSDTSRAAQFYQAVLGLDIDEEYKDSNEDQIWVHFNGTPFEEHLTLAFIKLPSEIMEKHRPMAESIYFQAEDLEDVIEKVAVNGGRVLYPRRQVGGGYISGFVDTEGNSQGFYTQNPPKQT